MTAPMLTLGQLGRAVGLARASLLHYESLGLLMPKARSAAGYRLYGEEEVERLRAIRRFRDAGLPLAAIGDLLAPRNAEAAGAKAGPAALLEARLLNLCQEVERLRAQQRLLARLLAAPEFRAGRPCVDKSAWVGMLQRAGFTEDDMRRWHADFEAEGPHEHDAFLRSLGLTAEEVRAIRRDSGAGEDARE